MVESVLGWDGTMTANAATSETDDTLEALANLPTMAQATVSPDGDRIALYYDVTGRNELHVLDVETGELTQWSDGDVPRDAGSGLKWDIDGERVFFHDDEDGNEQFDVVAIAPDGVEYLLDTEGQTAIQDVGPDGDWLLVGSSHGGQFNLYRHDVTSGETTKLTDYERAAGSTTLSPDGERIAYTTNETDDYENFDVYVADADGSNPRNLEIGETGAESMPVEWGPDGDRLLVADNTEDLGRCGIYHFDADEVTWYGGTEYEEMPEFFMPDGERFVAVRTREGCLVPVVYDVESGESHEFDLPDGVASFGQDRHAFDDSRVLVTCEQPTRRPELLVYDLDADEYETVLAAEYGPFDPDDFADAEYFTFESDGVPETRQAAVEHDPYEELEIGAMLYDSEERPSPLIVNPHGGPRVYETQNFDVFTQFLVSRGYSVLQVNYRGSAGRGREFVEALYGDWGGAEQGDVAAAAEHALDEYDWLDEDRVVMYGRSYGGFSAYWQAVQYPDLYDAVISWVGLSDLEDMHENTMPHFRSELMVKYLGELDENADLYEERSPKNYVENIDSPLLVLHGVNDTRVPVSQARIMREALEGAGFIEGKKGDFEYVELGEEGHSSTDTQRKIRVFSLLDDFLDRRLGVAS